jgi:hypothetical protein
LAKRRRNPSRRAGLHSGPSGVGDRAANRLVFSGIWEPKPFHADHSTLKKVFNDWRFCGVFTAGGGRPVNARILGDANQDGNSSNDRLPGFRRNFFTGPNCITTDLRAARRFELGDRFKLECWSKPST